MRYVVPALFWLLASGLAAGCGEREVSASADGAATLNEGHADAGAGVRLFYRVAGSGEDAVIVLHGGPGFTMEYLAADLEPLGETHTLIFYDQRGAGRSTLVTGSTALDAQRFADDLEAIRLHFGLESVTLLAHSWGAGVAALYAARYPEQLDRMVVVGGIPLQRSHLVRAFERLAESRDAIEARDMEAASQAWLADPGDATACRAYYTLWFRPFFGVNEAADRSKGDFCAGTPESLANKITNVDRFTAASLGEWDWRPALSAVDAQTLVIHGTADVLPMEGARDWATTLPDARLLVLPGIGHFPYVEAPETFFGAVEQFLQGRWPVEAQTLR